MNLFTFSNPSKTLLFKFCSFSFIAIYFILGSNESWGKETPLNQCSWFLDMAEFGSSAHRLLTCEKCHGTMEEDGKKHPAPDEAGFLKNDVTRIYDYGLCESCHPQAYKRYLIGVHAKALKEERKGLVLEKSVNEKKGESPTCGDCHSSHYVKAGLSRVEVGKSMTETCGLCHPDQKKTYLENYHGKTAVFHEAEASAYCSDCHGAHNCTSLKKKEVALEACQRCHPKAESKFVDFVIHASTKDLAEEGKAKIKKVKLINKVKIICLVFVIAILGFFYFHSFIWFLRKLHEKLRKR